MTREDFERRKRQINRQNIQKRRKQELKELRKRYDNGHKVSTSKLALLCSFIICITILIYSMAYMWHYADSSAMYTLVGVPVALMPIILGYYMKSKAENTEGGIVYDLAMQNQENTNEQTDDDGSVG